MPNSTPGWMPLIDEALALPLDDANRCELTLQAQRLFMDDIPDAILLGIPNASTPATMSPTMRRDPMSA